jgi:hypothetical protein
MSKKKKIDRNWVREKEKREKVERKKAEKERRNKQYEEND